jgi:hypothetical protein
MNKSAIPSPNKSMPAVFLGRRTHHSDDPFIKSLGLRRGVEIDGSINHSVHGNDLFLFWEHADIVLVGVRYPKSFRSNVRDAFMSEPIIGLGKSFIQRVVKILVMRENDMSSNLTLSVSLLPQGQGGVLTS